MRHVDESVIHAYLDGEPVTGWTVTQIEQHLDGCADCRAVLEDERNIRDGAARVLHDAGVATVDVPPFAMVAHAHSAERPAPRRRRALPLAWAASVMLALGAGWWSSGMWPAGRAAVDSVAEADAAPDARGFSEAAGAAAQSVANGDAATRAVANTDADARAVASGETTAQAALSRDTPVGSDQPATGGAAVATTGVATTGVDAASEPAARRTEPIGQPVPAGVPAASVDVAELAATETMRGRTGAAAAPTPAPAAAQAQAQAQAPIDRAARAAPPVTTSRNEMRMSDSAPASVSRLAFASQPALPVPAFRTAVQAAHDGQLSWRDVAPATTRDAGLPLLMVADAQVHSVQAAEFDSGARLVRVRQTLDDGSALDLLLWRTPDNRDTAVPTAPQAEKAASYVSVTIIESSGGTPDGGRELLLHVRSISALVLLSGPLTEQELLDVANTLVAFER